MACGDRVAVERLVAGSTVTYLHHGIDLGDGSVVHARPDDFGRPFAGGRVVRTTLEEFAAGSAVKLVTEPPADYAPQEVAARAIAQVGRHGYCPVIDNCEHFATWCATGRRVSRQVEIIWSRATRVCARVTAAASARVAGQVAVRTALGTTVRIGLRAAVPAAFVAEAAALTAEWRAHQAGRTAAESRRAGEAAGLAASTATCGLAGAAAGPAGMLAGALAGAALWAGGSLVAAATVGRRG